MITALGDAIYDPHDPTRRFGNREGATPFGGCARGEIRLRFRWLRAIKKSLFAPSLAIKTKVFIVGLFSKLISRKANGSHKVRPNEHTSPTLTQERVVVYVEPGCNCCRAAIELIESLDTVPRVVRLEDFPEIRHKHGAAVPIVEIDGRVRFFGKVDPVLLRRTLHHRKRS